MRLKHKSPKTSREPQSADVIVRLDRLSDVRQTVVARGKALVADPKYPDGRTLRGVARVLARNWKR